MKIEDVVKLIDQGFTKEEILRFETGGNEHETGPEEKEPQPEEKNSTDTKQDKKPEEEPKPQPQPDAKQDDTGKRLDSIEATMNKLLKAFQTSNIRHDSTGGNAADIDAMTDKVMASIIRPEQKG